MSSYTRTRTLGGLLPLVQLGSKWWNVAPDGAVSITGPQVTETRNSRVGEFITMSDVETKGFAKAKREGRIINSPMSKNVVTVTRYGDQGFKVFAAPGNGYTYYGEYPLNFVHAYAGLPAAANWDMAKVDYLTTLASTKAWADVKSPAVYGGVFLGEIKETINMFKKPLAGLQDFIRDRRKWEKYRGRKPKGSTRDRQARDRMFTESMKDGYNAAAQCWLEARLGWRPFLMELSALAEELENGQFDERNTARGSATDTITTTSSEVRNISGLNVQLTNTVKSDYSVRCGVLYQGTLTIPQKMGFSWESIPISAYELVPFSFVVDWFINLGDYIQAMTPKIGVRSLATWTTVRRSCLSTRRSGTATLPAAGWVTQRSPNGVDEALYETVIRTPGLDFPELAMDLDIVHALRNNRGWDALSLFIQQLQPKGNPRWTR